MRSIENEQIQAHILKIYHDSKKRFRPFPSKSKIEEKENILKRDFNTSRINEKWCTDITYIHTIKDDWCYLASVMDLFIRKIIGYSFSKSMDSSLAVNAVDNACIESFHASLKREEVNLVKYYDYNSAKLAIFQYIESWYNRIRIHGSIGYITHQQCEDNCKKSA